MATSFGERLQRENRWTSEYTSRVIDEYRRFIILAVDAGHPVTPSGDVDQAWHLHLTFTRSYWEGLCAGVLGRPLHHNPSVGGPHERAKFRGWYGDTLESYVRLFGADPPADIWPDVETRFGGAASFVRIDGKRNWVIPKPRFQRPRAVRLPFHPGLAVLAVGSTAAAATWGLQDYVLPRQAEGDRDLSSLGGWCIFIGLVALTVAVNWLFGRRCPRCHRRDALRTTGARRRGKGPEEEWVCRYCSHAVWRREPSDDGCG